MNIKIGNKAKINICLFVLALISSALNAQTASKIGDISLNIDTNAVLELDSKVKGFLLPRVPLVNTLSISPMSGTLTPGMTVFNTASINDVTPGFYYWNLKWIRIADSAIIEASSIIGILPVIHGGTGTATSSGTGNVILSNSPTFSGTPTLPTGTIGVTQVPFDSTSALATTAFVTAAITTNINLIGPITSVGNNTSVALQTGTGSRFVMDTSPTLVTPVLGVATVTSVNGTSIPTSKILVVTTDKLNVLSATTSSELAGVISDETGTGNVVLSNSPTFSGTPILPTGTIGVTQTAGDSTTAVATTAFVTTEIVAINTLADGKIYLGNSSNQATEVTLTGDVTVSNAGVTAITNGVIINSDVNANAAIEGTKIAPDFGNQNISTTGNTAIGGVLGVSGLATLNSVAVTTNATVGGNLNVTGTTTTAAISATTINASGTLGVLGATTLSATLGVAGVVTLAAQPILQTLTASLPVFTDSNKGLVSNPITGTVNVVMSDSPTLTGVPVAPTATANTNTTQLATTAFVLTNSDRYYSATSATEINTRTTSDEVVPGMSLTSELGGTYAVSFNAQYEIDSSDRTAQAAADMLVAYNSLMATANTETIASAIPTRTFTPGVYNIAAAGTLAAAVVITLNGSGTYIFKFGAALSMGAGVSVVLQGGATASDVFWIAEGAVAIGANSNIKGSLISNSGAVDLAAGCILSGKLLAIKSGAISISGSNVTNTGSTSAVDWGLIVSFSIFSKGGVISNAGESNVSGDIGTKTGGIAIASFATATVTGTYYTELVGSALASFSVYQNGTLIANSKRFRSSTLSTVDISLQAIATVGAGQNVEIRWSVDSGKITLKNRILTLISVR